MKSWLLRGFLAAASTLPVLGNMASASAIPFTWDPSQAAPPLSGAGSAFTADTINATNYLHSVVQPNGSFAQELILKINSFQLNGQSVAAPGLNSSYGLYFAINATGQLGATTSYSTLNISLMADPGNNDGSLSSSPAGVFFSNTGPSGVADDFILGAGTLIGASMVINPITMVRSAHYVESFAPAPNELSFFSSITPVLEVFLTTPPAVFQALPQPDGGSILLVNGGIAQANFVPEPTSIVLLASGLLGLGVVRRFRAHRVRGCPSVTAPSRGFRMGERGTRGEIQKLAIRAAPHVFAPCAFSSEGAQIWPGDMMMVADLAAPQPGEI